MFVLPTTEKAEFLFFSASFTDFFIIKCFKCSFYVHAVIAVMLVYKKNKSTLAPFKSENTFGRLEI